MDGNGLGSLADVMLGRDRDRDGEQDGESLDLGELRDGNFPRPANKHLTRLHVRKSDGTVHSFVYHHLDSNARFKGGEFTLVFTGAKHWELKVKGSGKKFWKVFDYITLFRWPFLVEATRDFGGGEEDAVFTSVEIRDVTPKMG